MRSIKTKLILAISILIIFLLGVTSYLLINEKERELTGDIYVRARSFTELTAGQVAENYETYLKSGGGFVLFKSAMTDVFSKDEDISNIALVSYAGEVLYDSETEKDRQYEGNKRIISSDILERIKAKNPSVLMINSGRLIYLKKTSEAGYSAVDKNERPVEQIANTEKIQNIIMPYGDKYAVSYQISYQHLQQRIWATTERIIYLTVFGILIGLLVGYLLSSGITKPLKLLTEKVLIIAKGDFATRVTVTSKDEVGVLANSVNQMAKDLEKSMKAMIYKERVGKELELAAKIQKDIIPRDIPKIKGLDIAAGLQAATEIGGDCYDFIQTPDEKMIGYIGDVTGHGVPSGLLVAVANALIFSFAHSEHGVRDILLQTNTIIKAKAAANMFMTMLMFKWEPKTEKFTYACAGHEQPVLYKAKEKKVALLEKGGMALGMLPDISKLVKEEQVDMEKGDVMVLYTDGIPEAWKNEKESYGMAGLKRAVEEYATLGSAEEIKEAILKDVRKFMGKYEQKDDITIVVIKRG